MIATSMIDRSLAVEIPMIGPRLVDLRAEQAADRTGHALTEIERLPFDLSALEQDGIFLNVDARNFGLLDRRLDWQALGISLPRTGDVAFRPPRCGLVPDRYRLATAAAGGSRSRRPAQVLLPLQARRNGV